MTLLVRDEEDIIAANIDYHRARGVDHFIVTDNRSVDGTREILLRYARQGIVEYHYEASDTYDQHRWVTRMARRAHTVYGADWVINNDADEFWWPEQEVSLKQLLESIPQEAQAVAVDRKNFRPIEGGGDQPFFEAMLVREHRSYAAPDRPLPPKVCHRGHPDIEVAQGNHAVSLDGRRLPAGLAPLVIMHFPLRSFRQFENKIVKGGRAYQRNRDLPPEVGWTWRRLYEQHEAGALEAHFAEKVLSDAAAREGIGRGELTVDTRLRDYLRARRVRGKR